jgi:hypothetical protein
MRGKNQDEQASGVMPPAHEYEAEPGLLRGKPDIHGQQHGGADAHRRTIHRGDHRLETREDAQTHPPAAVARGVAREVRLASGAERNLRPVATRGAVERRGAGGEIRAGTECPARTGDDYHFHIVVAIGAIEGVDQLLEHFCRKRIELVRAVERDREDSILDLISNGFIGHRSVLSSTAAFGCACVRSYAKSAPRARFPSPPAGEGGEAEHSEAEPDEGSPLTASRTEVRSAPFPTRGRGSASVRPGRN